MSEGTKVKKIAIGGSVDPELAAYVDRMAAQGDRSKSAQLARIIKYHMDHAGEKG